MNERNWVQCEQEWTLNAMSIYLFCLGYPTKLTQGESQGESQHKWHLRDWKSREMINSHGGRTKGNWMNLILKAKKF